MNEQEAHDQAEALLPWFVTGRLDECDRALIEAHLECCAECRNNVERERRIASAWRAVTPEQPEGLRRLRERISGEAGASQIHLGAGWRTGRAWWGRPPVAWAAAIPFILLISVGLYFSSLTTPAYRTLGAEDKTSANLIILFRPEAREIDMRRALRATGATLVGGPTSADAYLLHVEPKQRAAALADLDANEDVLMVEPVDEASP
jgi:hypothetical protein